MTRAARRDVLTAFVASRLLVLVAAALAAATLPVSDNSSAPDGKIVPGISHPFGDGALAGVLDAIFTPLLRWDGLWYLTISRDGYVPTGLVPGNPGERAAFFPLYPLVVHVSGGVAGAGATLILATVVSLAAFAAGLVVVHRLAELELGADAARGAVFVLAFWPASYFFSAPYTESLFLALSAGAFLAARTRHWAWAGILGALAAATRNTGVLLLVPLVLLYVGSARPRRLDANVLWLALVPLGLVAYMLHLDHVLGDAQAWRHAQEGFGRPSLEPPWTTIRLALAGVRDALRDPGPVALPNVLDLACLLLVAVATVGAFRRLPAAYGAWIVVALLPALCSPFAGEALRSLPRFAAVLFPIAIWLGWWLTQRRLLERAAAASALLLVALTAAFTAWLPFV
jgi:hypothetical protein